MLRNLGLFIVVCMALAAPVAAEPMPIAGRDGIHIPSHVAEPYGDAVLQAVARFPKAPGKYPLIVFVNSWGMDEKEYLGQDEAFARRGYVAVSYSSRGWSGSSGMINAGGVADREDLKHVIDWCIKELPADPERVGLAGISYGGSLALLGAAADERVKAVAAMSCWASLLHSLVDEGTPSALWAGMLKLEAMLAGGRLDPLVQEYLTDVADYDITADLRRWAHERSPYRHLPIYNRRRLPILFNVNLQDALFRPDAMWQLYRQLQGPSRMLVNQGKHAVIEIDGMDDDDSYVWEQVHQWMDRYVKGEPGPSLGLPRGMLLMKATGAELRQLVSIESERSVNRRVYYLSQGSKTTGVLSDKPATAATVTLTPGYSGAQVASSNSPLAEALAFVMAPFTIPWQQISEVDRRHAAVFMSEPVAEGDLRRITGIPHVSLPVRLERADRNATSGVAAQFVTYLYDVDAQGVGRLITYGPITVLEPQTSETFQLDIPMSLAGWDLGPGHRLALVIGTRDPLYSSTGGRWNATSAVLGGPGFEAKVTIPEQR